MPAPVHTANEAASSARVRARPLRARAPLGRRAGALACWLGAALLGLAPLGACKTGPDLSADYGQTALENYELALGEFADRDWDEAIAYADFVRIRFPFSRYAVEAELLVARAEFARESYIVAQDAFRQFAKLHPTHKHVRNGWVSYMAALSAFRNAPSGFFLLPPYYQKDQSQLRDALTELQYFFDHHTGSRMEPYALRLRDDVNRRLLEHELYVARYYLKRDHPEAAIMRLEAAHERYPGIGLDAEVLFQLGLTYLRLDEIELARATFTELQNKHPTHHHGKQARLYLKYIYDEFGPADPNRPRPDRSPPTPPSPILPKDEFNLNKQAKQKEEAREKKSDARYKARERKRATRYGEPEAAPNIEPGKEDSNVGTGARDPALTREPKPPGTSETPPEESEPPASSGEPEPEARPEAEPEPPDPDASGGQPEARPDAGDAPPATSRTRPAGTPDANRQPAPDEDASGEGA